ncbi:ABC transporter permease [Arthrobacter sp. H14-L1]|uniref:ABC transporter permease n=1 Tax=Arthrobacter sp. H14-L1 TaxID=2996697 RepID=UPI00226D7E03|nr:FtsX-like permease family protein [Arthrobacter sp. H14-L1]MCY0906111.1 FtsX-like permease family protein [Arthrobacter sp. H14-L1]
MSVLARSVGNAFRNKVRSGAVVIILAVAIGLALSMLVANQAVADKITSLKASVGNNLTVNPAGSRGGQGGGEPLTAADLSTASTVAHVSSVTGTLSLRLSSNASTTATAPGGQGGGPAGRAASGTTSLVSAIDPGTLGNRANGSTSSSGGTGAGSTAVRPAFSIPIEATGIAGAVNAAGVPINITDGTALNDFAGTSAQALVGSTLATKNSLKVGSMFTVDDRTMTISGIFDAGTAFDNNAIYLPLTAAQTLASRPGEISTMTVLVDSIDNVDAAKTALASALGSTRVDVTAGSANLGSAISSLSSVQSISLIGFIAALGTAGLIVLLIMIMVVRERRREIGVLKAIGASNRSIGVQFVFEALVLVVMGSVVGAVIAAFSSNSIVGALVSSNTGTTTAAARSGRQALRAAGQTAGGFGAAAGPGGGRGAFAGASRLIGTVSTSLGWQTLVLGVLGILLIAALGALIPALLTAKVRPIEVLRGE